MTTDRDLERLLDTWFVDTAMPVPDRAFDVAVERVHRQSQRPAWRFLDRRLPTMSTSLRLIFSAGVLLAVVLGGTILLSSGGGPNIAPSPTPTATPSPTPISTPLSPTPALGSTGMQVQGDSISWRAILPAGWKARGSFATSTQGPAGPTGIAVAASGAVNVPIDPCDRVGDESDGATVTDVVAMLEARDDLVMSNQIDATLGGYSGTRVDVQMPADLSACTDAYILFAEPDGSGIYAQGPSNLFRVWILDVEGQTIVFWVESFPETPAADMADAQAIVDSIVITP